MMTFINNIQNKYKTLNKTLRAYQTLHLITTSLWINYINKQMIVIKINLY